MIIVSDIMLFGVWGVVLGLIDEIYWINIVWYDAKKFIKMVTYKVVD